MSHIELLANALEYIEIHLDQPIKTVDIANACYCSKSALERLFKFMNNISVHDYIIRRRMTRIARELCIDSNNSLLELAIRYGYSSNEAFTRAFTKIWYCTPSEYRKNPRSYELFPRLVCPWENGEEAMKPRRRVDISELYDLFMERKNCYFVCCDIKNMMKINEVSRAAGDLAIIESLNRMYDASGEEDVVFRIGGDEFALLTNQSLQEYAQSVADSIAERNQECIHSNDQEIPLQLYTTITCLNEKTRKYADLFQQLHKAIENSK